MSELIFKICRRHEWAKALGSGVFGGSGIDLSDGYIHFSTEAQMIETAKRHFAGQADLVLVAIDPNHFGDALKWESARGGDLFPHLYAALPTRLARWVRPLPLGADGAHVFPDLED